MDSLGKIEAGLVARLAYENKNIVSIRDLNEYLPSGYKYRNELVYSLKKKNILIPVKRGFYIFVPLESMATGRRINSLLIPPVFFPRGNYYVGYSTMYNYYNFTEQLFQTVYVLNTSPSKTRVINGITYKFICVDAKYLYGLATIKIENSEVLISSKERTLVDLLYFNKPVGGVKPATDILRQIIKDKECDIKTLIEYTVKFPNITTRKRMGVCLEGLGVRDSWLKPLADSIRNTALSSLGNSRKGSINKKWRVIVNTT